MGGRAQIRVQDPDLARPLLSGECFRFPRIGPLSGTLARGRRLPPLRGGEGGRGREQGSPTESEGSRSPLTPHT